MLQVLWQWSRLPGAQELYYRVLEKKYICVNKNFKWYFVKIQCFEYLRMWLYVYLPHYLGSLHCIKLLYNNPMLRCFWSNMERKIQWFAELSLASKNNPLVQVQTKQIRMACWTTQREITKRILIFGCSLFIWDKITVWVNFVFS